MIRRLIMSLALFTLLSVGIYSPVVYAYAPFQTVCSTGGAASSVCKGDSTADPLLGPNGLIIKVTNLIAFFAGIAAIILLIIGGIKYITSNGDSGNIASARNTITYALIGLVVIVLAKTIVQFVVSKV